MKTILSIRLFLIIPGNLLALVLGILGVQSIPTNLLGWFVSLFSLAYMVGGAIFLWPQNASLIAKADRAVKEEVGDKSFWVIIPGFVAVFFVSPVEYLYLGGSDRTGLIPQIMGLALIFTGLALRIWTRAILKSQYTGHLQTVEGSALQTGGPYHFIRHPGYAGFLLLCLGLGVGFNSYLGLAAGVILLLPGLIYRMYVEEELLINQFGDEYRAYAVRTKRLIPGVW